LNIGTTTEKELKLNFDFMMITIIT
jgi:hypothetical protein